MRYALTEREWQIIQPILPSKPRGIPRVDDRRVLDGIFWVLRSGAPWRDRRIGMALTRPATVASSAGGRRCLGPVIDALSAAQDLALQMIDTSVVRVHQHGACVAKNRAQQMGRSRGGLSTKIHAVVDGNGLPVQLASPSGEAHDNRLCALS